MANLARSGPPPPSAMSGKKTARRLALDYGRFRVRLLATGGSSAEGRSALRA